MTTTNTDDRSIFALTDAEAFDKVMPRWARVLNAVYEATFGNLDRLLGSLTDRLTSRKWIVSCEVVAEETVENDPFPSDRAQ